MKREVEKNKGGQETVDPMSLTSLPLIYLLFFQSKLALQR